MLRILRAMQFLAVLMVQTPERMATERQRIEQIVADAIEALQKIRQSSAAHQAQLDQRLVQLPADIAEGIDPEAIAATINESLRQQFVQSTIPATAEALASTLGDSYRGAAEDARRAVANFESTSSRAISSTKRAAEELVRVFREEYRWSLYTLLSITLLVGIGIGMLVEQRLSLTAHTAERTPVVQQPQPIKPRIKP
jgi:TolA-binding protein